MLKLIYRPNIDVRNVTVLIVIYCKKHPGFLRPTAFYVRCMLLTSHSWVMIAKRKSCTSTFSRFANFVRFADSETRFNCNKCDSTSQKTVYSHIYIFLIYNRTWAYYTRVNVNRWFNRRIFILHEKFIANINTIHFTVLNMISWKFLILCSLLMYILIVYILLNDFLYIPLYKLLFL